jgi:hypothetical protein
LRPQRQPELRATGPQTVHVSANSEGRRHFKLLPPSAPERTFQASGQGQAIARPKGGPPCCSVPVPSTRWSASGASPPLKTSCVCLYQDKLTHAHVRTCASQKDPREKKSRGKPAAGASKPQNVRKLKQTSSLMPGSRKQIILLVSPTHKRTEGRAPVWGSEFTSKRRRTTGGVQQKPL